MKEKYKQQLSTAAREVLEHSGLSFTLMGDKMAVSPRDKAVKLLKAHPAEMQEIKAALLAEQTEERETAERRRNFRAAIPGLKELEAAKEEQAAYREAFSRAIDSGDGIYPHKPKSDPAELSAQYPMAAAMLRAESYSRASNYHKAAAGQKAVERILDGEDWEKAISDMEAEWKDAVSEHMWD
nr:MAG TPA: hypothetical protein [Caudoviricetes sp.]